MVQKQGVGRFILTRTESAFMMQYGVKSLLKREEAGGVLSNLIFAVPESTSQKTVTELEMSNVVTSGNAGSFQKFDDTHGVITVCSFK